MVIVPSRADVARISPPSTGNCCPEERARRVATDHGVWVAIASFAGSTGGGYDRSAGRSGIWSPDGSVVARAGPETGAIVLATLN